MTRLYCTIADSITFKTGSVFKQFAVILVLLSGVLKAEAQTLINGTVTNEKGAPMNGVSVKVKNKNNGVSTNAEGHFTINVPEASAVLVFSSVG